MSENWWTEMEQRVAAANAEKDRQSMDQMQQQIEKDHAASRATIELAEKMVEKTKRARDNMNSEIAEIQAEADKQIQNTKDRYAARYGDQKWNTADEKRWRDFTKGITEKYVKKE